MRFDLLLHDLIYQAIRNQCFVMYQGSVWRTFLHVKDAAMAYIHLLNAWSETTHNVFNIGSPSLNILKRDIADRVSLRFPMTVVQNEFAEDPDQRDYRVSYDRIMATGWQAYEDLDASIGRVGQLVQVDRVETKWRLHV
jgi:nucleoside-diphosphate-sugar epimerase